LGFLQQNYVEIPDVSHLLGNVLMTKQGLIPEYDCVQHMIVQILALTGLNFWQFSQAS
jgi:hypothetical protein